MGNEQKLKIVKWTAGLDHSVVGRAKQLYPAFGDDLSDMPHDEFKFWERKEKIAPWVLGACAYVVTTPDIETRAEYFETLGVKASDAIHLASAESADCDWFFTVDDGILKKVDRVGKMRVANPLEYIQEADV